eukprot:11099926-Karenia_brevis.AAC.1
MQKEGAGKRPRQPAPSLNPTSKKPPRRERSDESDKPHPSMQMRGPTPDRVNPYPRGSRSKLAEAKKKFEEAAKDWVEAVGETDVSDEAKHAAATGMARQVMAQELIHKAKLLQREDVE